MRRISAAMVISLVWLVVAAPPAAAHSAGGVDATNFTTRLTTVTPQVPGIDVEILENGDRVQVTNTTAEDLVVLGYQGEPYLRVGPDGVFENRRSPATYMNQDRRATTPVPPTANPELDPDWQRVGDGQVARWHEHRVHWMGEQDPPAVQRDPDERHTVIPDWVVTMEHGDTTIEARGDVLWIPGPDLWPWIALVAVLLVATVGASRLPGWRATLAVLLVAVVAVDLAHAVGVGLAAVGGAGTRIVATLSGSSLSVIGWATGVAGAVLVARRREQGLYVAAFAAAVIALNGGVLEIGDVSRSQLPFAWPGHLLRVAVAVALGVGLGIVAASMWRLAEATPEGPRSADPDPSPERAESPDQAPSTDRAPAAEE